MEDFVGLPLSILALAAGVYLLVKVKREYMGGIFEVLSWLVIVLSLVSVGFMGFKSMHHCGGEGHCGGRQECRMEKQIIIKDDGMGHCSMDSSMHMMGCCKMEGDSMVMDKGACEMAIGKEACEKMCKERGRCIMSKEECARACSANGHPGCCAGKAGCGDMGGSGKKGCCKH
jgi:hypothetical protein